MPWVFAVACALVALVGWTIWLLERCPTVDEWDCVHRVTAPQGKCGGPCRMPPPCA